jgi:hypothetical protein
MGQRAKKINRAAPSSAINRQPLALLSFVIVNPISSVTT